MKHMKKYIISFLIVFTMVVVGACNNFIDNDYGDSAELRVLPPFIFVFDKLYKGGIHFKTEEEFNKLELKPKEIGPIKSKVSVKEIPTVNFQSNAATIGSILYYQDDYSILYCKDDENKYWIYKVYKEN